VSTNSGDLQSVVEIGPASDQGYYLVGYYIYHARDGGISVAGFTKAGHEHDLEGVWLVIKKSPYFQYGQVIAATSEAHGALIPAINYSETTAPSIEAAGGWPSPLEFWKDARYSTYRPVFGVRSLTHGTYPAQQRFTMDDVGIDRFSTESSLGFQFTVHSGTEGMIYAPVLDPSDAIEYAPALSLDARGGTHHYMIQDLASSGIWAHRSDPLAFAGGPLTLAAPASSAGLSANTAFVNSSGGFGDTDPMWHWIGGPGESHGPGCRWHSFATDNTFSCDNANVGWPTSAWGGLLGGATAELNARFLNLPETTLPQRWNPFIASPPSYYSAPTGCPSDVPNCRIDVSISGPEFPPSIRPVTWTASVTRGYAPFAYSWSGIATGTGASVSASVSQSGYLYLDVTDAIGHQASVSLYVTANDCGTSQGSSVIKANSTQPLGGVLPPTVTPQLVPC
jgi:hypothetical protein